MEAYYTALGDDAPELDQYLFYHRYFDWLRDDIARQYESNPSLTETIQLERAAASYRLYYQYYDSVIEDFEAKMS